MPVSKTNQKRQTGRRGKSKGKSDESLREHVLYLLGEGGAHASFDQAVDGLPAALRSKKLKGIPFSAWGLLEHMRIAQWDILEFSRNAKHVSPDWPEGYWPTSHRPPSADAWDKSVRLFHDDLAAIKRLVRNPEIDLLAPFPYGNGQTLLREALLLADHNAYHVGELILLRRMLGAWPKK